MTYQSADVVLAVGDDALMTIDLRSPAPPTSRRFHTPLYAVAAQRYDLIIGSEGRIYQLDTRSSRLLHVHTDFVADDADVVCARFDPFAPADMFVGTSNGDIIAFNTADYDTDEWLQCAYQCSSDVRAFTFAGPTRQYIAAMTTDNAVNVFDAETAEIVSQTDLAQVCGVDAVGVVAGVDVMDYLVDLHYDGAADALVLSAGNNNGQLALYQLHKDKTTPTQVWSAAGYGAEDYYRVDERDVNVAPHDADDDTDDMRDDDDEKAECTAADEKDDTRVIASDERVFAGHSACIRSVVMTSAGLLSGGEDSLICRWTRTQTQTSNSVKARGSEWQKPIESAEKQEPLITETQRNATRSRRRAQPY